MSTPIAANDFLRLASTNEIDVETMHCGFESRHRQRLETDAQFASNIQKLEADIVRRTDPNATSPSTALGKSHTEEDAAIYNIPVVVHVVHTGQSIGTGLNISDAQIQSAIENLNAAYSNTSTPFSTYTGVDTKVRFCLAARTITNEATTGIVRVDGSSVLQYAMKGICDANGGTGVNNELAVKSLSRWDNNFYFNIWVVNEINDNGGGAGDQGYAYFPGASGNVDGLVILYNAIGYDPDASLGHNLKSYTNRNTTAIHELGHALGLFHTFQGDASGSICPTDAVCGSSGDCVSDTPRHMRSLGSCVVDGTSNACQAGTTALDFQHNFMDQSSQTCQSEFTAGQVNRMIATLSSARIALVNGVGCVPVVLSDALFGDGFES